MLSKEEVLGNKSKYEKCYRCGTTITNLNNALYFDNVGYLCSECVKEIMTQSTSIEEPYDAKRSKSTDIGAWIVIIASMVFLCTFAASYFYMLYRLLEH